MVEILWHRRETRRQTEKTKLNLKHWKKPVYSTEAGIDPQKKFDSAKGTKADFIIDKLPYKHGVLLICESHEEDGSIITGPSIFVKENGLWKATFEFSSDEKLWDYIDYVKPEGK